MTKQNEIFSQKDLEKTKWADEANPEILKKEGLFPSEIGRTRGELIEFLKGVF